jgi:hypothetical protein
MTMRRVNWAFVLLLALSAAPAEARQELLEELPQDLWSVVGAPMTSIARETRRFDPISRLWFGLVDGSVKSLERTAALLLQPEPPPAPPEQPLVHSSF